MLAGHCKFNFSALEYHIFMSWWVGIIPLYECVYVGERNRVSAVLMILYTWVMPSQVDNMSLGFPDRGPMPRMSPSNIFTYVRLLALFGAFCVQRMAGLLCYIFSRIDYLFLFISAKVFNIQTKAICSTNN